MKEETFFANKLEVICTINSTMNSQSQLNCITSAGRLNFPIYKALVQTYKKKSKFKTGEPNQPLQSGLIAIMRYSLNSL